MRNAEPCRGGTGGRRLSMRLNMRARTPTLQAVRHNMTLLVFAVHLLWLGTAFRQSDAEAIKQGSYVSSSDCSTGTTLHQLTHGGLLRRYYVHVGMSACSTARIGSRPPPVLFALHCYGCMGETMMKAFKSPSDSHGFVLVVPEGIESSWSAKHCCGAALERNLDDVGFLQAVKSALPGDLANSHGRGIAEKIMRSRAYVTGWSNGGYMAVHAVITGGPELFAALAPIAGLQDDGFDTIGRPVPMMIHHSLNDPFVAYHGCCGGVRNDGQRCCCGITGPCDSARKVFERWALEVNHCAAGADHVRHQQTNRDGGRQRGAKQLMKVSSLYGASVADKTTMTEDGMGITCVTAGRCDANTTLCTYKRSGHFNHNGGFHKAFPERMVEEILQFFLGVDSLTL